MSFPPREFAEVYAAQSKPCFDALRDQRLHGFEWQMASGGASGNAIPFTGLLTGVVYADQGEQPAGAVAPEPVRFVFSIDGTLNGLAGGSSVSTVINFIGPELAINESRLIRHVTADGRFELQVFLARVANEGCPQAYLYWVLPMVVDGTNLGLVTIQCSSDVGFAQQLDVVAIDGAIDSYSVVKYPALVNGSNAAWAPVGAAYKEVEIPRNQTFPFSDLYIKDTSEWNDIREWQSWLKLRVMGRSTDIGGSALFRNDLSLLALPFCASAYQSRSCRVIRGATARTGVISLYETRYDTEPLRPTDVLVATLSNACVTDDMIAYWPLFTASNNLLWRKYDQMWVTLIIMLIQYFMAKKNGASNGKAAVTAAVAGAGTYYVATQTDWGKATLGELDKSIRGLFNADGSAVTDANGNQVYEDAANPVARDASGNVVRAADGSIINGLVGNVAGVLKSWGGAGTAAVVASGSIAAGNDNWTKYLPWALGAVAVYLVLR